MEERDSIKVCVTGGSGYIASWLVNSGGSRNSTQGGGSRDPPVPHKDPPLLVKKLLEKGYTVHATLRNLDEKIKVDLLKSLPHADTRLVLFQADIYNPGEFEPAIEGCHYVFHLATPLQHNSQSTKYKDTTEAAIAGVKSIADCCIRSQSVKRLIYTASVMSTSPLKEDGTGFKSSFDESCWTPLNFSSIYAQDYALEYTKSKTSAEREVLSYNEIENGKLEVVSLPCGLVGGDNSLLSYLPASVAVILSQITGNLSLYDSLRFLQELLGSIPLVHIDDVCEAHIFCLEKESLRGRFLCAAVDTSVQEIASYYQENYPLFQISQEFKEGPDIRSRCDNTKLMRMGFEYKYGVKDTLDGCVDFGRRLQVFSSN